MIELLVNLFVLVVGPIVGDAAVDTMVKAPHHQVIVIAPAVECSLPRAERPNVLCGEER